MSETVPTLSERVRMRLRKKIGWVACPACGRGPGRKGKAIVAPAARQIEVSPQVITRFLGGADVKASVLDKISTWLDDQVEKDAKR